MAHSQYEARIRLLRLLVINSKPQNSECIVTGWGRQDRGHGSTGCQENKPKFLQHDVCRHSSIQLSRRGWNRLNLGGVARRYNVDEAGGVRCKVNVEEQENEMNRRLEIGRGHVLGPSSINSVLYSLSG